MRKIITRMRKSITKTENTAKTDTKQKLASWEITKRMPVKTAAMRKISQWRIWRQTDRSSHGSADKKDSAA